jgi:hypothetical protein
VRQVGHLQELYRDARSTEHTIQNSLWQTADCAAQDRIPFTGRSDCVLRFLNEDSSP